MTDAPRAAAITVRPAIPDDADGIARTFLESAEHHARLDRERYWVPSAEAISARYREGGQHPADSSAEAVTLVAEFRTEIVGFVDARLYRSPDAMHRELTYCYIAEIAVSSRHQSHGIGAQLLRAAEDWGRSLGAEFASLEYLTANTRAGVFYQQHMGYHAVSITAIKRL